MKKSILRIVSCLFFGVPQPSHGQFFEDDRALFPEAIVLEASQTSKVLVSPAHQGRVLVSTLDGESLGWINRERLKNGEAGAGGADRLWFAPDGSQYTIFFEPGIRMQEKNWRIHPDMGTGSMKLVKETKDSVLLLRQMNIQNHVGTNFPVSVRREVRVLKDRDWDRGLSDDVLRIGFRVENTMMNMGPKWQADKGLIALWSLATFAGGEEVEVKMRVSDGKHVRKYFTPFQDDQFAFEKGVMTFRCNGNWWSKIGITPEHAPSVMTSLDSERLLLTVVKCPVGKGERFPRAERGHSDEPYDGDAVNVYNHGNLDRTPFNKAAFYEMESASAMPELDTGETISHWQEVRHYRADLETLKKIQERWLAE